MPAHLDLSAYQGDGFTTVITFDPALDFSESTLRAQIRHRRSDPTVLADFEITVGDDGTILLALPGSVTATLPSIAVWDIEETVPGGEPSTLLTGSFATERQVTR